jgi:hypothetical protein
MPHDNDRFYAERAVEVLGRQERRRVLDDRRAMERVQLGQMQKHGAPAADGLFDERFVPGVPGVAGRVEGEVVAEQVRNVIPVALGLGAGSTGMYVATLERLPIRQAPAAVERLVEIIHRQWQAQRLARERGAAADQARHQHPGFDVFDVQLHRD